MNQIIECLNKLIYLSNKDRDFSITKDPGGLYVIKVGKYGYQFTHFTEEVLLNALICINSQIAIEEKWWDSK